MQILLIDDDASFCRMLKRFISADHLEDQVCELHSKAEVEDKLGQLGDVDIAIIDRNLDGENVGPEIERMVKQACNCLTIGTTWYEGSTYGDKFIPKERYTKILEVIEEERQRKTAA